MLIRVASAEDAAKVCTVLRRSITELCAADHQNDPQILSQWLANKTEENLRAWIAREGQVYLVAEIDGRIAGVAAVSATDGVLLNYVSPDYQYRGVSKALMAVSEGWLKGQGQVVSRLTSTATAKQFYEKLGYLPEGDAKTGRSGMPSFPMKKLL
ncbi:GNAT family N-acetyltransferase [Pseudochrobactrum algeriensis]|uniref:GNAT family N-acetyltransferase n=1 Tax=Pseudochrobactrum algeriensis TaxID=2834768 RepID=UPI001BCF1A1A|nr:GNAT family N-acetyltransferase [Pseudochrobactrum algeriensis]MBX8813191.1 GNAT family N-acetyltransferase [Ochrobactrum sp. MR34]QVQ36976.1 GNAT family N-acetyltransferase [Pseudochrobactrum algeriensis]QVQ40192.1 GNAT family N-acetyltransferase [Pseudochrobactrum algeriensis]QVQ44115.1 GNAT family N-acetyltransferase [Pseudochrobactrum algeriensis]